MTTPDRYPDLSAGEASDRGRFEPTPYDLGITDDPEAAAPVPYSLTPAAEAALEAEDPEAEP